MEGIIVMTVLGFSVTAAMFTVAAIIKEDMIKSMYVVGLIAIVPAMIGLSMLIAEVKKSEECKEKYELIQEPVYRKIE